MSANILRSNKCVLTVIVYATIVQFFSVDMLIIWYLLCFFSPYAKFPLHVLRCVSKCVCL